MVSVGAAGKEEGGNGFCLGGEWRWLRGREKGREAVDFQRASHGSMVPSLTADKKREESWKWLCGPRRSRWGSVVFARREEEQKVR